MRRAGLRICKGMKRDFSRRKFLRTAVVAGAAMSTPVMLSAAVLKRSAAGKPSAIKFGLASYTFRNFSRAQAIADYTAAGIKLHAAGAIYFLKDNDDDIRAKVEYCKRAGVAVIVAGDPTPASLPRVEKFVKEYDIRIAIHNHGP